MVNEPSDRSPSGSGLGSFDDLLDNNKRWVDAVQAAEPDFFSRLLQQQAPEVLWIGCCDSRLPANQVLGLQPGQVFVHRNVGNQACHMDTNAMACLEYAVDALKVKHVVVCGHHGCGAVKGALMLPAKQPGLVNLWISGIREIRNKQMGRLQMLESMDAQWDRLAELNVISQMYNVCTTPTVQAAWDRGQQLAVHGLVYSLDNPYLQHVVPSVTGLADLECLEIIAMEGTDDAQSLNTCSWFVPTFKFDEKLSGPKRVGSMDNLAGMLGGMPPPP